MSVRTTVVIPHYQAAGSLALVLAGLDEQTMPPEQFEVVVADDGSTDPPSVGSHRYRTRVLYQERRGFRAAAARNLGLHAADGDVVCFLDCDVVPGPDYLATMSDAVAEPQTVVVGSRRHVDLSGWDADAVRAWSAGRIDGPPRLPDPQWLADGYAATDDLRASDDTSFRFVISAVLGGSRRFLCDIGGFDERFVGYGGEDWELAQRCWLGGADLLHVPGAVAFHDGPDLAGRTSELTEIKNRETAMLAKRLTHPMIRGRGMIYRLPDLLVEADVRDWSLGQLVTTIPTWLEGSDVGVWLTGGLTDEAIDAFAEEPRVRTGTPPVEATRRCRFRICVHHPVRLRRPLGTAIERAVPGTHQPAVSVTRTRDLGRARTAGSPVVRSALDPADIEPVPADVLVERLRQASA